MNTQLHIAMGILFGWLISLAAALLLIQFPTTAHARQRVNPFVTFEKSVMLPSGPKMAYMEKGDPSKTTVLFIHGITDSWHSFEPLLERLPENIHSIAVTLRGHGESGKPDTGYTPMDFARDVADFIHLQNIDPCIVVGHSMGGLVAQQLALAYPQLVKGLVLMSTDAYFPDNPGMPEFVLEIAAMKKPVDWKYAEAFQLSTCANPVDADMMKLWTSESMKVPLTVWKQALAGILEADFRTRLSEIKVPTLILAGNRDNFCPMEGHEFMHNAIQESRLKIFESLGHAVHWENPEAVSVELLIFLKPWL